MDQTQERDQAMPTPGPDSVSLEPLAPQDRLQFRTDLQAAFMAAVHEQGPIDPEDGPIPSDADIDSTLDAPGAVAFHILAGGQRVGGAVLAIDAASRRHALDFFFVKPGVHGRGIGQAAWRCIEARYPETLVWETHTPYFERSNIHFYVNKCGFRIVEFFNLRHPDPHQAQHGGLPDGEEMFRFEKRMDGLG